MKKYLTSILFILVLVPSTKSQVLNSIKNNASIVLGGNYASISYLDQQQRALLRPLFGASAQLEFIPKLLLEANVLASFKASTISSSTTITGQGVDFYTGLGYKLDDFIFKGGFSFQSMSATISSTSSDFTIPSSADPIKLSQTLFYLGTEFMLNENINFFFNHTISAKSDENSVMSFGIKYYLERKKTKTPTYKSRQRQYANRAITELREGVLLVRLQTREPTISALKKHCKHLKAEKVEQRQYELNLELVNAFRKRYKFSEVQFFYSNNSNKVKSGKMEGIFLNNNLSIDSSIIIDKSKKVYTAEFTNIEADTFKAFSHYIYRQTDHFSERKTPTFYGAPNLDFKAVVIKDQSFTQIAKPFPYYSRYIGQSTIVHPEMLFFVPVIITNFFTPSFEKCVERLNSKVDNFLLATNQPISPC